MLIFNETFDKDYKVFISYINVLTLFYKFVTFSINLLLFDHGICYFLKYSAGNPGRRLHTPNLKRFSYDKIISRNNMALCTSLSR